MIFNSIYELGWFVDRLGENNQASSDHFNENNSGFSYQSAITCAIGGGAWPEGAAILEKVYLSGRVDGGKKAAFEAAPCGFIPVVPNALMGLPNSMLNSRRVNAPRKVLKLGIHAASAASCNDEKRYARGAAILSIIDALESAGYLTEIHAVWCNRDCKGNSIDVSCIVKNTNETPNLSSLAFVFCSWAFSRRLLYRMTEKLAPKMIKNGYGAGIKKDGYDFYINYGIASEWWQDTHWRNKYINELLLPLNLKAACD